LVIADVVAPLVRLGIVLVERQVVGIGCPAVLTEHAKHIRRASGIDLRNIALLIYLSIYSVSRKKETKMFFVISPIKLPLY